MYRLLCSFYLIGACLNDAPGDFEGGRLPVAGDRSGVRVVANEQSGQPADLLATQSFYVAARVGWSMPSLDQWRSQFDPKPPTDAYLVGGEIGVATAHGVHIGVGIEYFLGRKIKASGPPDVEDRVHTLFYFGSLKAGSRMSVHDKLFLYGGIDAGILAATEDIGVSGYPEMQTTGSAIAVRPKAGLLFLFQENVSVSGELAYLWGKVTNLELRGNPISAYGLDLTGLSVLMSIQYHIPM